MDAATAREGNTAAYSSIEADVDPTGICRIMLNRPEARNGYTVTMANELQDALRRADANPAVRVVLLGGNGKNFCVGADLSDGGFEADPTAVVGAEWEEPAGRCSMQIYRMNKPVIVAVRGAAVGAGSTIILSADYRLAADDARFGFVFSRRGIYPEGASTWFLPRLVGVGTALDWMVSGRVFGADEARRTGLVTAVHSADGLMPAAERLARELIATTAPVSVAVIRRMIYECSGDPTPDRTRRVDSRLVAGLTENSDAAEGVSAFLHKRDPRFPGTVPGDIPQWLPWVESGGERARRTSP